MELQPSFMTNTNGFGRAQSMDADGLHPLLLTEINLNPSMDK